MKKKNSGNKIIFYLFNKISFSERRKQVKSNRKLIPRRSKVFPKDFFSLENNIISPSKKEATQFSSPKSIEIINPISKRHFSERQANFDENLKEKFRTSKYFSDKPHTPKDYFGDEVDEWSKEERVLKNLININLSPLIAGRNRKEDDLTKFKIENFDWATTSKKQRIIPNIFRSLTEIDENFSQQKTPSDSKRSKYNK